MAITHEFRTGYMDNAVFDLAGVLREAVANLTEVKGEFDTLVGTGFSGGIIVPALALRLRRKFVLVRKDDDDSHHSGRLIGELGERWIFVDDFTSSGRTRRRVIEKLQGYETTLVGSYYYGGHIEYKYQREVVES